MASSASSGSLDVQGRSNLELKALLGLLTEIAEASAEEKTKCRQRHTETIREDFGPAIVEVLKTIGFKEEGVHLRLPSMVSTDQIKQHITFLKEKLGLPLLPKGSPCEGDAQIPEHVRHVFHVSGSEPTTSTGTGKQIMAILYEDDAPHFSTSNHFEINEIYEPKPVDDAVDAWSATYASLLTKFVSVLSLESSVEGGSISLLVPSFGDSTMVWLAMANAVKSLNEAEQQSLSSRGLVLLCGSEMQPPWCSSSVRSSQSAEITQPSNLSYPHARPRVPLAPPAPAVPNTISERLRQLRLDLEHQQVKMWKSWDKKKKATDLLPEEVWEVNEEDMRVLTDLCTLRFLEAVQTALGNDQCLGLAIAAFSVSLMKGHG